FEGPLLSIKSVSSLAHYTDWVIGHVHGGALGWNGFMAAGMFYWLVPRLWGTKLYSEKMADAHFWMGTFGILLYITAMWISGISQGLYWRALDAEGFLKYPDFVEWIVASRTLYIMRLIGGIAYFSGWLLLIANVTATIRSGKPVNGEADVRPLQIPAHVPPGWRVASAAPVTFSVLIVLAAVLLGIASPQLSPVILTFGALLVVGAILMSLRMKHENQRWHAMLEGKPLVFTFLVLLAILAGGVAELVPSIVIKRDIPLLPAEAEAATPPEADQVGTGYSVPVDPKFVQRPYSPLELEGRDVYVSEGCYNCHSQMIRPFRHETLRYGAFSRSEEYIYDHPFQWGSKRTGPDLHREGGKYPNLWHYQHLMDPRSTSPGSNMPPYEFMKSQTMNYDKTAGKLAAMRKLGVPYDDAAIRSADATARSQAALIQADLATQGVKIDADSRMIALIAYLQRLGRGPQPTSATAGGN
ncbi:MAG: cytochrome-c oxidase, cbb3-type subunit II, partial [Gemmatimonadetes bacterium]|nr:cytochrome-c oxidase, cbb3-type subunit II [Gemmatimonadota bacterium]